MSICYTIIQPAIKKFEWNNGLIQKSTHPFYCNSSLESWWAPWSELLIRTDNPRRAGVKLGLETLWHLSEDGLFSAVCGRMVMGMMLACARARVISLPQSSHVDSSWLTTNRELWPPMRTCAGQISEFLWLRPAAEPQRTCPALTRTEADKNSTKRGWKTREMLGFFQDDQVWEAVRNLERRA